MMSLARHALAVALLLPVATSAAWAQASKERAVGFGNFGSSKEPIKIDANKLDVLDKDNKAVFSGNVVAVQGETTVRCSVMTVFYEGRGQGGTPRPAQPAAQGQGGNDGAIKRIECSGPVTVVSKTQAATSDNAVREMSLAWRRSCALAPTDVAGGVHQGRQDHEQRQAAAQQRQALGLQQQVEVGEQGGDEAEPVCVKDASRQTGAPEAIGTGQQIERRDDDERCGRQIDADDEPDRDQMHGSVTKNAQKDLDPSSRGSSAGLLERSDLLTQDATLIEDQRDPDLPQSDRSALTRTMSRAIASAIQTAKPTRSCWAKAAVCPSSPDSSGPRPLTAP